MLNIKPEIWTRNGKEEFVVLSMSDFEKVQEMIEDVGLSRILRESMKRQANARTYTLDEVKQRLGMKPSRPRRRANGSRRKSKAA